MHNPKKPKKAEHTRPIAAESEADNSRSSSLTPKNNPALPVVASKSRSNKAQSLRPVLVKLPPPPDATERMEPLSRTNLRKRGEEENRRRNEFVGMATHRMKCRHFRQAAVIQVHTTKSGEVVVSATLRFEWIRLTDPR
jgi:hypothetical protein